jgi:tRNA nucleotidyltransferase/poly(A) polymerase
MRVRGMFVDFVNLRAETYAQSSRIPTMVRPFASIHCRIHLVKVSLRTFWHSCDMKLLLSGRRDMDSGGLCLGTDSLEAFFQEFGTAEQDALRRDLTINR